MENVSAFTFGEKSIVVKTMENSILTTKLLITVSLISTKYIQTISYNNKI